jgi:alkylated DNA repair dioxygenase AlkB
MERVCPGRRELGHAEVVSPESQESPADQRSEIHVDREVELERLDLGGNAWVDVARGWLVGADLLFEDLFTTVAWQTSRLFRYDHFVEERRLGSAWRSGLPLPHPALAEVTRALQHTYRVQFPGFGMIQYRDGHDGQAFHRDTDMRWLDDTTIAILTLGAERPWLLRPRTNRYDHSPGRGATHDLAPGSGDLIVMGGSTQADWEHSVPYLPTRPLTPRISIQWRFARRTGRPFQGSSYRAPLTYGRG